MVVGCWVVAPFRGYLGVIVVVNDLCCVCGILLILFALVCWTCFDCLLVFSFGD